MSSTSTTVLNAENVTTESHVNPDDSVNMESIINSVNNFIRYIVATDRMNAEIANFVSSDISQAQTPDETLDIALFYK